MEAPQPQPPARPCTHCGVYNPETARFCKSCGAALLPPPECPACGAETTVDAKFCAMCGTALIGARPVLAAVTSDPPVEARPAPAPSPSATEAVEPESDQEIVKTLRDEAASLPPPRRPSSNILSNVLMFVAFLLVMVVVIYKMNQDAPKVISPFQGGPAPSAQPAKPAESAPAPVAAGTAIEGRVELGEGMQSGGGTLFVIVRQAGVTRGPPVAVKKVDSPTFPHTFSVSAADTMIKGMPFNGPFDVQVRLDQDGNAMTKSAGDLIAASPPTGIKPGGVAVVITLDQRL